MKELKIADTFDIGTLVGERKTLSKLAGSCSAADALCLRKIRESKQYLSKARNWEEFCRQYLGLDRSTADRLIRHLEEFGLEGFEAMHQLGLTPKQYRLLAPQVKDKQFHHEGEAIALLPENGPRIHAVLRDMRPGAPASEEAEPGRQAPHQRITALGKGSRELVKEFWALAILPLEPEERQRLSIELDTLVTELCKVGR
jgi:hypothetical protein